METLQLWGSQFILAWQTAMPGLADVMRVFSFLGNEEFYLLIMPALYWCLNPAWGAQMAVLLLASNAINVPLKLFFHLPRPFWVLPAVQAFSTETTYGLPSGHAQNALAVWGWLGLRLRATWAWALAAAGVSIVLISVSRIYLGVHFPQDTLAGWLVGALLLSVFIKGEAPVSAWWKQLGFWQQVGFALTLAMLHLAVSFGILLALANTPDPASWATQAQAVGDVVLAPRDWEWPVSLAGMIFGAGLALALLARRPSFYPAVAGSFLKRAGRYGLGLAGVLLIWQGLDEVFPTDPLWLGAAFRFLRYALILLWILYLAPVVFERVNLSDRPPAGK